MKTAAHRYALEAIDARVCAADGRGVPAAGQVKNRVDRRGAAVVLVFDGGHVRAGLALGEEVYAAAGCKLLAPSRPGYARTPLSTGSSAEGYTDVVRDLCAELGITRVTAVVGVSGGGPTAATLAARHSDLVERLILVSAVAQTIVDAHHNNWRLADTAPVRPSDSDLRAEGPAGGANGSPWPAVRSRIAPPVQAGRAPARLGASPPHRFTDHRPAPTRPRCTATVSRRPPEDATAGRATAHAVDADRRGAPGQRGKPCRRELPRLPVPRNCTTAEGGSRPYV